MKTIYLVGAVCFGESMAQGTGSKAAGLFFFAWTITVGLMVEFYIRHQERLERARAK